MGKIAKKAGVDAAGAPKYTFHYMEERDEGDAAGCYTMCMPLWEDTIDEDDILLTWTIDSACNLPQ